MHDRHQDADPSQDILINGVNEIADSLAGGSAETPSVAEMMAGPTFTPTPAGAESNGLPESASGHEAVEDPDEVSKPTAQSRDGQPEPADSESSEEEKRKKRKQPGLGPRWSYILTRGIIVASVWAFFAFAFDPILRHSAITAGQQAVQAKVDIAALGTSFFPPRVSVTKVSAANRNKPGTNLFEFESMEGDVDGFALMHGAYVLDKAVVSGLTWNTSREDDGLLPDAPPVESEGPGFGDQLEEYGKEWASDILERAKLEYDPRQLESIRLAQQLEVEWKTDFDGLEERIRDVDAAGRQLKQLVDQTKKMNPLQRVEAYRRIATDGSKLLREVSIIRDDLKVLPKKAEGDLGDLDEARKRDQAEIKRKVEELVLDGEKLSEFLLGPTVHHRIRNALTWLDWGSQRVSEFSDTPEPERHRGDDVRFPMSEPLPDYLARLIEISGHGEIGGDQMSVQGTISDVSSDAKLYGKPTVIRMSGQGEADVQMKAELDRTRELPKNTLDVAYVLDKATTSWLGDDDSLQVEVRAGSTRWNVHLETTGDQLTGTVLMVQEPVLLVPDLKTGDEKLSRLIAASMQEINRIDAEVELSGTIRRPQLKLKTSLGESISKGVRQGFSREVSAQKDALIAKLDAQISEQQGELVGMFRGKYGDIIEQLNVRESGIQELIPKVAGRTLDPSRLFR